MRLLKQHAEERISEYKEDMELNELSERTIHKYIADIKQWLIISDKAVITKETLVSYKNELKKKYKAVSVNSKITSINRYIKWLGYPSLVVRTERVQAASSIDKTISKDHYYAMIKYAKNRGKTKLLFIMKTMAGTGMRVGELKYVTVEAITRGFTQICNKGKYRNIYFSERLCGELLEYCKNTGICEGIIFKGKKEGKVITSAAVWKGLKNIAKELDIPDETVFPHSFRHLFAKNYMEKVGDITELADVLGHSRLETTWIYTRTSSAEKRKRLGLLDL